MKKVKDEIISNLKAAIVEANFAGHHGGEFDQNDLPEDSGDGDNLYGCLEQALRHLIGNEAVEQFFEDGYWD